MKQTIKIIFICIFLFAINKENSFSQNIPYHISFDTVLTNTNGSVSVYVKNPTGNIIHINSIRTLSQQFFTTTAPFSVNAFDSVLIPLFFRTNQNVTYNDFIIFESNDLNYSIIDYLKGTAKYPDTLYRFTQGLSDEPLKTALKSYCSTNTNNNYTTSRTAMFSTIDDYNMDDTIECVYTGRKVYTTGIPSVNPPQSMNTEHTFPQGFFNMDEPMRSDIHHLYPTDEVANNRRNNFDFGFVVSNVTWENGGSKLGTDAFGQIVFEARDRHKGNIARCLFYFLIRYQNYGNFMDAIQENVLRQWNLIDTVDAHEKFRENGIEAFQHNRSPFVDHPEFIDRIKSTFTVIPNTLFPDVSASPFNFSFDTLAVNDTASLFISLLNHGAGNLNINSITSSASQFTVENFPAAVSSNEIGYAKIKFRPNQVNQTFASIITIDNNDSLIRINLTGHSNNLVGVTGISSNIPVKYSLNQNYPNPFNPSTNLEFGIPLASRSGKPGLVSLKIYDMLGKEIAILVNKYLSPGNYSIKFDAANYPSGIYYYKLTSDDFSYTKKMTLLK